MKKAAFWLMVILYIAAGINHFISPLFYAAIVPGYLPWHLQLVYISGVAEFVLGILLIPRNTRRFAAWGIVILLIAVFPANIQMMQNRIHEHHPGVWVAVIRLPIQLVLIWWAWLYTRPDSIQNK
ncbi:MAG: MauE/DoxX family redox-associated membrane protein [Ferruginibacter sp.]